VQVGTFVGAPGGATPGPDFVGSRALPVGVPQDGSPETHAAMFPAMVDGAYLHSDSVMLSTQYGSHVGRLAS